MSKRLKILDKLLQIIDESDGELLPILRWVGKLAEDIILVALLAGMILLAAGQIIGRNLFNTTFFAGDELLRIMVLWLTLAGAVAASKVDKHISINLIDRFLPDRLMGAVRIFNHLFTATVCGLIAWYSASFVWSSYEYGDLLLGSVPAWKIQIVLPLGFGLMSYRHGIHAVDEAVKVFKAVEN